MSRLLEKIKVFIKCFHFKTMNLANLTGSDSFLAEN